MDKSSYKFEQLLLDDIFEDRLLTPVKGRIEFAAFNHKKNKPEKRLKGYAG
jgi:hypothetical protein